MEVEQYESILTIPSAWDASSLETNTVSMK